MIESVKNTLSEVHAYKRQNNIATTKRAIAIILICFTHSLIILLSHKKKEVLMPKATKQYRIKTVIDTFILIDVL